MRVTRYKNFRRYDDGMDGLFWVLKWPPLSFFDIKLLKDHNPKVNRSTEFNLQLFCGRSVKNLPIMCTDCSQNFFKFQLSRQSKNTISTTKYSLLWHSGIEITICFLRSTTYKKYISLVKVEIFEDLLYSTCHAWL